MKAVAFAGPSLPSEWRGKRTVSGIELRPMARRGDIQDAAREGADIILLIDGEMVSGYGPSVEEVHEVIQGKTIVVGGSSLGALRAVELCSEGMLGAGWVFKQFASGRMFGDTDLLCVVMPQSGEALTIPLVNLFFGVGELLRQGLVDIAKARELRCALRYMSFDEREPARVLEAATRLGLAAESAAFLISDEANVKTKDARLCFALIERLRNY